MREHSSRFLFGPIPAELAKPFLGTSATSPCLPFEPDLGPPDWDSVCESLPLGWRPDAVVLYPPGGVLPAWVWSTPLPVIGLAIGWDATWHHLVSLLSACDAALADPLGAERLRRVLPIPVAEAPLFRLFTPPSTGPQVATADLVLVAPFDSAWHRIHPGWLPELLARLHDLRVRVCDPEDPGLHSSLSEARFVAVYGLGAETASVAFRAIACGARVLLSREDWARYSPLSDAAAVLPCSLPDLPRFVRRLLKSEADEGRACLPSLASWFEAAELILRQVGARRPTPADATLRLRVGQVLACGVDDALRSDLESAPSKPDPSRPSLDSALGFLASREANDARTASQVALPRLRAAAEARPTGALAWLNFTEALALAGLRSEACLAARRTLELLGSPDADFAPGWGPFPATPGPTRMEWERLGWEHAGCPEDERRAKTTLLRARLLVLLGRLTSDIATLAEGVATAPERASSQAALGRLLLRSGRPGDSIPFLRQAILRNPFPAAPAADLHEALGAVGDRTGQASLADERLRLHRAAPRLVPAAAWFAPSGRPTVSLCLIVRDEEVNLAACLGPVRQLVDEIVVIDTGSTDRTREIATALGARVFDFPWCDSFADARNEALRRATGDWILWLDADDRLDEINRDRLSRLLAGLDRSPAAYMMRCVSPSPEGAVAVDHVRLFRRIPEVRWRYRVHEQILLSIKEAGGQESRSEVEICHVGYLQVTSVARKLARNLRLLRLDASDHPGDPYVLFNLGWTLSQLGQTEEAIQALRESVAQAPAGMSTLPKAFALLVRALAQAGRPDEALVACHEARARFPGDIELRFQEAALWNERGLPGRAEGLFRSLLETPTGDLYSGSDLGLTGHKARHALGVVLSQQGRVAEAESHWRSAIDTHPSFRPSWLALAELLARQTRWADLKTLLAGMARVGIEGPEVDRLRARSAAVSGHLPRVVVLCIVHNEEAIIDQFLNHYARQGVDAVILLDNESTDSTAERARRYPFVTLEPLPSDGQLDDVLRNAAFQRKREQCASQFDYAVIVDADEFVLSRNGSSLAEAILAAGCLEALGTEGYEIIHGPDEGVYDPSRDLTEQRTWGIPSTKYSKPIVLRTDGPSRLTIGQHTLVGSVPYPTVRPFLLLHYASFDEQTFMQRRLSMARRQGKRNADRGHSVEYYRVSESELRDRWRSIQSFPGRVRVPIPNSTATAN